jgi:hypothetical protein
MIVFLQIGFGVSPKNENIHVTLFGFEISL